MTALAERVLDTAGTAMPAAPVAARPAGAAPPTARVWKLALVFFALELVAMLVFSTLQYRSFGLTRDFAGYSNAWVAIAHGHLDPYSSAFGTRYWKNNFELLMWPLALLYWVFPHGIDLLWVQDLAVVATEVVALAWARDVLVARRSPGTPEAPAAAGILGVAALLFALDPFIWFTIGFDVHFEVFTALFGVLAARELWKGRHRRLLIWVPLTLACNSVGGIYVLAIGLSAVLAPRHGRRAGALVAAAGLAWVEGVSLIGGAGVGGRYLNDWYGYLASDPRAHLSALTILVGLLGHPWRGLQMLSTRAGYLAGYLTAGGIVGLGAIWAFVPAAAVLVPNGLNSYVSFSWFPGSFQSWPAIPFLVVGTVMVLDRLFAESAESHLRVARVATAVVLAASIGLAIEYLPKVPAYLNDVSPAAARALGRLEPRIPPGAEVIASQGVSGRLGERANVYPYWAVGASQDALPVTARTVVFVITPEQGGYEGPARIARRAVAFVRDSLHAGVLADSSGVFAFEWHPPVGTTTVQLP